jgi:hypothetical protein
MLSVVAKEDRPKPAVVILRDAADEPRRIVAHYSLRSLFDDLAARANTACGTERPRALVVFRLVTSSYSDHSYCFGQNWGNAEEISAVLLQLG